jgi:hypothetical protein
MARHQQPIPGLEAILPLVRDGNPFLEHGKGAVSAGIRLFTGDYYNHAGLCFWLTHERRERLKFYGMNPPTHWGANTPDEPGQCCVVEARWTVDISLLADRLAEPSEFLVATNVELTDWDRQAIVRAALGFAGQKYGTRRLGAFAADILTRRLPAVRTHLLRRMELDDIICSYLVAYVYDIVGWRFGVPEVRPRDPPPAPPGLTPH